MIAVRKTAQAVFSLARIDLHSGEIEPIPGGREFASGLSAWDGSIAYVAKKPDGSCETVVDGTALGPFTCRATSALGPAEIILSSEKHLEVRKRAPPFEIVESFASPNIRLNLSPDGKTLAFYNPASTSVEVAGVRNLLAAEVAWKAQGLVERRIVPTWNWDGSLTVTRGFRPYISPCSDACADYIRIDPTVRAPKGLVMKRAATGTGFLLDFMPKCPTEKLP